MSQVKTPLREIRLRVAVCAGVMLTVLFFLASQTNLCFQSNYNFSYSYAIDRFFKVFSGVTNVDPIWIAWIAGITFASILFANARDLLYFIVKVFFHSTLSIFFSSMEVLGRDHIPLHGPVIFTGNHMNQFVDAACILVSNPRNIGFLVAEKSYNKPIIGHFAKALGSIPVARPQDCALRGPGQVSFEGLKLHGKGTKFTEIKNGDKIRPGRSPEGYRITHIVSDIEATLVVDAGERSPLEEDQHVWKNYDILGYIDQSKMFDKVHSSLAQGKCLCIFPEGGSHDHTDLLPLKVGVAAIAYGALEKFDLSVPIVPVGLTYFRGHRFRGRVVVEFGAPVRIDDTCTVPGKPKREAYRALLEKVSNAMRSTIVTASNYSELKLVHTLRRLYQRPESSFTTQQKQDLSRRFSLAYHILLDRCAATSTAAAAAADNDKFMGNSASAREKERLEGSELLAAEMVALRRKLEAYQSKLDHWGLKDYQIPALDTDLQEMSYSSLLYTFGHAFFVALLASIPTLLLNAPVGLAARLWAKREAAKDLKASRVKLAARDVLLSKKILFSLVAVPSLWISYALLLLSLSPLRRDVVVLLFVCCPLFSYFGVRAVEAGMVDLKDLRPIFLRLLPSFADVRKQLPRQRAELQRDVRAFVKRYGPTLGPLYEEKELSAATFDSIQRQLRCSHAVGGDPSLLGGEEGASLPVTEAREKKDTETDRKEKDAKTKTSSDGDQDDDDDELLLRSRPSLAQFATDTDAEGYSHFSAGIQDISDTEEEERSQRASGNLGETEEPKKYR